MFVMQNNMLWEQYVKLIIYVYNKQKFRMNNSGIILKQKAGS